MLMQLRRVQVCYMSLCDPSLSPCCSLTMVIIGVPYLYTFYSETTRTRACTKPGTSSITAIIRNLLLEYVTVRVNINCIQTFSRVFSCSVNINNIINAGIR